MNRKIFWINKLPYTNPFAVRFTRRYSEYTFINIHSYEDCVKALRKHKPSIIIVDNNLTDEHEFTTPLNDYLTYNKRFITKSGYDCLNLIVKTLIKKNITSSSIIINTENYSAEIEMNKLVNKYRDFYTNKMYGGAYIGDPEPINVEE